MPGWNPEKPKRNTTLGSLNRDSRGSEEMGQTVRNLSQLDQWLVHSEASDRSCKLQSTYLTIYLECHTDALNPACPWRNPSLTPNQLSALSHPINQSINQSTFCQVCLQTISQMHSLLSLSIATNSVQSINILIPTLGCPSNHALLPLYSC